MELKMIPSQLVLGCIALFVYGVVSTGIAWKWPDLVDWMLVVTLVLVGIFLIFVYRSARKAERDQLEK